MEDRHEWLKSLKVGDTVCYQHCRFDKRYSISTIKKITPKRYFVLTDGLRFNSSGDNKVNIWHTIELEKLTDEIVIQTKKHKLVRKLRDIDFNSLDYDKLVEINKIISD